MPDINDAITAGGFEDPDTDFGAGGGPESLTGGDDLYPDDAGFVGADDTGVPADGDVGQYGPEIGPVPYSRFKEVNDRLRGAQSMVQAYEQLQEHPLIQEAILQAASQSGHEQGEGDPYTQLLDALSSAQPETPIEQAVQMLLPELIAENRALRSEFGGVRDYTLGQQQEAQIQAVDTAITSVADRHGMQLDDDGRIALAEEANLIFEGSRAMGQPMSVEEAFDRAARIVQSVQADEVRRQVHAQIDTAKEHLSLSRPGQVRGPVTREAPQLLSHEDRMMRCYRLAGGTE